MRRDRHGTHIGSVGVGLVPAQVIAERLLVTIGRQPLRPGETISVDHGSGLATGRRNSLGAECMPIRGLPQRTAVAVRALIPDVAPRLSDSLHERAQLHNSSRQQKPKESSPRPYPPAARRHANRPPPCGSCSISPAAISRPRDRRPTPAPAPAGTKANQTRRNETNPCETTPN